MFINSIQMSFQLDLLICSISSTKNKVSLVAEKLYLIFNLLKLGKVPLWAITNSFKL